MRASKDLAKRLRFDLFPKGDFFRHRYFLIGAVAAVAGLVIWVLFSAAFRQRQYLPGPVSQNHATFGDRCEKCHTAFKAVPNVACLECHPGRLHSEFEDRTPECQECHVEHRNVDVFLSVSNRTCVHCHGQLVTKRPQPIIQAAIKTFSAHPVFSPLREGKSDQAALRFNHKLHLTSDKIAANDKLVCASCHLPDADGRLIKPIVFEPHCKRCHEQKPPNPIGAIEAPHKTPDVVRLDLSAQLLVLAVANPEAIFKGRASTIPGIADRPPVSAAQSLQAYQGEWLEKLESELYKPFDRTTPLLEHNKFCFLCHIEQGERAAGELPQLKETKIPKRWLERGGFAHRKHDMMACKTCHADVEKSEPTSDVNLPKNELCLQCHIDARHQSAGTNCMECHLYHDTSKNPELRPKKRKEVSLDVLKGG